MADGSGRDSYVVQDNGGLRPEYDKRHGSPQRIFAGSLRSGEKSPLKYFKDAFRDRADITCYRNWISTRGKLQNEKHAKIQRDVVRRLTRNLPTPVRDASRRGVREINTENIPVPEHQRGSLTVRNHKVSGLDVGSGAVSHLAGAGRAGNEK